MREIKAAAEANLSAGAKTIADEMKAAADAKAAKKSAEDKAESVEQTKVEDLKANADVSVADVLAHIRELLPPSISKSAQATLLRAAAAEMHPQSQSNVTEEEMQVMKARTSA